MTAPAPPAYASPIHALKRSCVLLVFRLHPGGFLNRDLRGLLTELLAKPSDGPGSITPGQATYDLRRLREHGLIQRIPHTHRYQVTDATSPPPRCAAGTPAVGDAVLVTSERRLRRGNRVS
jgi:hypothetical protein